MGAGAKAQVGAGEPVFQVVPGLKAGLGKVGDLVLVVARSLQPLYPPQVHVGLLVVGGQDLTPLDSAAEGSALLHLQAVAGQVLWLEGDGLLHRVLPAGHILTGQAVDQVQSEVFDLGLPDGGPRRGVRVIAAVADAVGPQIRLHSVHDPVHPVFLAAAAGDIGVPVLGGRTEVNLGHENPSFSLSPYGVGGKNVIDW